MQKPHQGVFMNALAFSYNRLKKRQRDDSSPHHLGKMKPSSLYADRVLTHLVSNDNSTPESDTSLSRQNKKMVRFYEQNSFQKRAGRYLRRWLWCIGIVELCICTPVVAAVLSTQSSVDKNHFACITPERDVMFFLKASEINGKECKTHFRKISKGLSAHNEGYVSVHYRTGIGAVIFNSLSTVFDNQAHQTQKSWLIIRDETNYCWRALYEPDYNHFNGIGGYTQILELKESAFASECANINTPRPNTAPSADAGNSYSIMEGTDLVLDASGSSDADGDSLSYAWDLDNDGTYDDATGVNPTVTWETLSELEYVIGVGSFSIGLEVNDGKGGTDIAIASLTITSPVINSNDDKSGMIESGESSSMTEQEHFTKGLESFLKGMEHYDNKDYVEAVKWIREAAEHNLAQAQNRLGLMYELGIGVTKDYQQAVKWYRKAAEQGLAKAQNNLGVMYLQGQGITQNGLEAAKWFHKAAEQENVNAQTNLGMMYFEGRSVTQNYQEAAKWYRKAAKQGDVRAQNNLGGMYMDGIGVTQNYQEAIKWFRKAAEQGHVIAQHLLGIMYEQGKGVTQNDKEAIKWNRKSAEQGFSPAQFRLGWLYIKGGNGIKVDYQEALKWFRKAAEQGNAEAQQIVKQLEAR